MGDPRRTLSYAPGPRELVAGKPPFMATSTNSTSRPERSPSASANSTVGAPSLGNLLVLPRTFVGDDAALVAALREGHLGAKAEFFGRYAAQVERIITHVIGYDRDLPDILQETFSGAVSSLHLLESPSALRPWLFRIATLSARKTLRSRSRRAWLRFFVDADDEARHEPAAPQFDPDDARAVQAVYKILARLPADQHIAFALRFIDGMDLAETAAACDVSIATIKRRLKRAEERFLVAAKKDPRLSEWLERGSRWTKT